MPYNMRQALLYWNDLCLLVCVFVKMYIRRKIHQRMREREHCAGRGLIYNEGQALLLHTINVYGMTKCRHHWMGECTAMPTTKGILTCTKKETNTHTKNFLKILDSMSQFYPRFLSCDLSGIREDVLYLLLSEWILCSK